MSRLSSVQAYQESHILSSILIERSTLPLKEQRNLEAESKLGINCKLMTPRQKIAHSQSENRYRRNPDARFLQLEDVVSRDHCENTKTGTVVSIRLWRVKLLGMARRNMLELQKEVMSLKKKLRVLREAFMPETCRLTMKDEVIRRLMVFLICSYLSPSRSKIAVRSGPVSRKVEGLVRGSTSLPTGERHHRTTTIYFTPRATLDKADSLSSNLGWDISKMSNSKRCILIDARKLNPQKVRGRRIGPPRPTALPPQKTPQNRSSKRKSSVLPWNVTICAKLPPNDILDCGNFTSVPVHNKLGSFAKTEKGLQPGVNRACRLVAPVICLHLSIKTFDDSWNCILPIGRLSQQNYGVYD
jgi:hypothetical protein